VVNSHSPFDGLNNFGATIVGQAEGCDLPCTSSNGFADAQALAEQADVAVVFLGLYPGNGGGEAREDEGWDRKEVRLPGLQLELLQAIYTVNPNVVLVLINGGALGIGWAKDKIPSIVEAFYPGEMGGDAIASVLLGDYNPSGRLPFTIYDETFVYERPLDDMSLQGGNGITYRYYKKEPLWEFGDGLSYTKFSYELISQTTSAITTTEIAQAYESYFKAGGTVYKKFSSPVSFSVSVKNVGAVCGDHSVIGFLKSTHKDAPLKELFAYDRVSNLCSSESAEVSLQLPAQVLALVNDEGVEYITAGNYEVTIGSITASFVVTGDDVVLFSYPEQVS